MALLSYIALSVVALAATQTVRGPVVRQLGEPFVLRAGTTATITGEGLRITFDRVITDSRCPQGAQCVSEGEVVARVRLTDGRSAAEARELKTTPDGQTVEYARYQVTLLEVEPIPRLGRSIRPSDYAIRLVVRPKE